MKDIGKGSYGVVSKIKMKETGIVRAAKIIPISAIQEEKDHQEKVINEIAIPATLDHPNINSLY